MNFENQSAFDAAMTKTWWFTLYWSTQYKTCAQTDMRSYTVSPSIMVVVVVVFVVVAVVLSVLCR